MNRPDPNSVSLWEARRLWEAYFRLKHLLPSVREPLYHSTSGPRAAAIVLRGEGMVPKENRWGGGIQAGFSMTRNLDFALKGDFGRFVLVFDREQLRQRFKIKPYQHPIGDEYEERVLVERIPARYVQAVIVNVRRPLRTEVESYPDWPVPVIYRDRDTNAWRRA